MSLTNRVGLLAGFATVALSGVAAAETPASSSDTTMKEIAALKAELAALKSQQGDSWLTEQRASEIRSLVQDVLADADSRASLQSSGMTAGWDKGFFLASPDGNFKLRVGGQVQIRYILNYRDIGNNPQPGVDPDRWKHGFENRRTKLNFTGNIVDKTWTYKVQGNFSRGSSTFEAPTTPGDSGSYTSSGGSGTFNLEDAWLQKDFDNGLYVRFGQYKAPYLREELVSSARQLTVERSLVNSTYGQTYTQGASLGYQGDQIRAEFMYSDGIGRTGSDVNNFWGPGSQNTPWQQPTTEWAATGRVEYMAAGEWKQFDDFTSWNGEPFGLLIGIAANWQRLENDGIPDVNSPAQQIGATADVSVEFGGANLYGAFIYSNGDIGSSTSNSGNNQYAFIAQGGIFVVPDTLEIFGRYEWADPDSGSQDDLSVLTAGINWYFAKHAAKLTVDFGFSFQDFGAAYANSGAGWIDAGNADEYVLRAQFQLLF